MKRLTLAGLAGALMLGSPARAATLGDVNGDGVVTVADAVRLLKGITGTAPFSRYEKVVGNVYPPRTLFKQDDSGDQPINVLDVIFLLRYTAQLVSRTEFGAADQFIAVDPLYAPVGSRDQIQFLAVPFNIEGSVTWSLTSSISDPGTIQMDGTYTAPRVVDGAYAATVKAKVGNITGTGYVYAAPPPPPPPPG